jgi:hypothetical protein
MYAWLSSQRIQLPLSASWTEASVATPRSSSRSTIQAAWSCALARSPIATQRAAL